MALKLIVNSVWQNCPQVKVTDLSDAATADTDNPANFVGGPRHIRYAQSGTGDRRFVYVNKAGGLTCDTLVIADASSFVGHGVQVHSWATYTGATTVAFSASAFAETLYGPNGSDWVASLGTISSKQAFGVDIFAGTGGAFSKVVNKIFFGTAYTFNYNYDLQISPNWSRVLLRRQSYLTEYQATLSVEGLSKTELDSFQALYNLLEEPFFLWDSDGTRLSQRLWYVITLELRISPRFDDLYDVSFVLYRLRSHAA